MFLRLPLPDIARMEKLRLSVNVTAYVIKFLCDMQDDFGQPRAMVDLRRVLHTTQEYRETGKNTWKQKCILPDLNSRIVLLSDKASKCTLCVDNRER